MLLHKSTQNLLVAMLCTKSIEASMRASPAAEKKFLFNDNHSEAALCIYWRDITEARRGYLCAQAGAPLTNAWFAWDEIDGRARKAIRSILVEEVTATEMALIEAEADRARRWPPKLQATLGEPA